VRVRVAQASDVEGVVVCARGYELEHTDDDHVAYLFYLAEHCGGMFVAEDQGQIVGFLCSIVMPHAFSGRLYLEVIALFVQPSHRNTWAAGALLRKMLDFAAALPLDMVKIAAPMSSRLGTVLHRAGFKEQETVMVKGARWQ
jgi:GNAT superfamily N-acetyltransferase